MEVILALAISIFVFEVVFFVYMSLFRSWDIGFLRGRTEDEARRAVQAVSLELRQAAPVITVPYPGVISYQKDVPKYIYLYNPATKYGDFITGSGATTNYVLKMVEANSLDDSNYGAGRVLAVDLVPPTGLTGGTRFSNGAGLVNISIISQVQNNSITMDTVVYPRSVL